MNKIEELRKTNKLSQQELGEKVGVSQNTISSWETEMHLPPTQKLIILSQIFNVSTDYLLGRDNANAGTA